MTQEKYFGALVLFICSKPLTILKSMDLMKISLAHQEEIDL